MNTSLKTAVQAVIAEWEEHGFATDGQMKYLCKALEAEQAQVVEKPVAYWIPKAEQFCLPDLNGQRPFAKAWEPLFTRPAVTGERAELIAAIKHELAEFAHNKALETLLHDSVDMLEADAQQRSKPHGHCTHPKCRDIWSAYLEATEKLSKYEPGAVMHLNNSQQVAVPVAQDWTHEAREKAGYEEGWNDCMTLFASHMKRMNNALVDKPYQASYKIKELK